MLLYSQQNTVYGVCASARGMVDGLERTIIAIEKEYINARWIADRA